MSTACNATDVRLPAVAGLVLETTLFGGQTFRWRRLDDESADGWIGARPVRIRAHPDALAVEPLDGVVEGLHAAAERYFDADRDYAAIERRLSRDARLRRLSSGIRILRQPPFETVVGFVVSANNNIPRITRTIERLAELAGREVSLNGRVARAFPEPAALAEIDVETLRREANLGYRDRYVAETARLVASGSVDLDALDSLATPDLRAALSKLPGVGPKVGDCIALFAYGRLDVFPVDTWVRRIYSALYLDDGETVSDREMAERALRRFGPYAGVAQQYLFEAARRGRPAGQGRSGART